MATMLDENLAR